MGKHINQAKKPVSVLVITLLALTGIVGFTQLANAEPTPPELCVASQDEADFNAMISGSDPDLIEIETTGDLVRWSQSYDLFRTSDVVIRASELVLDCVFPAIPVFSGNLNAEYSGDASSISVIRLNAGVTSSIARDGDAGVGMFSKLDAAGVYNLQIEGLIESDESLTGALAGIASGTIVRNTTVTAMTIRVINPEGISGLYPVNCSRQEVGEADGCIGGLVGLAWNTTLDTIRTSGELLVSSDDHIANLGGVVGFFGFEESAVLKNLESNMNLDINLNYQFGNGLDNVGGVIGYGLGRHSSDSHLVITNSVNRGSISLSSSIDIERVGGLIGFAESELYFVDLSIFSSHNYGSISSYIDPLGCCMDVKKVGGLVGESEGDSIIRDSSNSGLILAVSTSDVDDTGGLLGYTSKTATVLRSHNYGDLDLTANEEIDQTGGLIGEASNVEIVDSSNSGDIEALGNDNDMDDVGGLVGYVNYSASVARSHNSGDISASVTEDDDVDDVGGLLGDANYVTLVSVYNSGSITVESEEDNYNVGGLVGTSDRFVVSDSSNRGPISVSSTAYELQNYGGLIGYVNEIANITNSHNSGAISITTTADEAVRYVGGFIGQADSLDEVLIIDMSTNSGALTVVGGSDTSDIGGLVGFVSDSDLFVLNSANTGDVTVRSEAGYSQDIGGLVGSLDGDSSAHIEVSENSGYIHVTALGDYAQSIGGLVGWAFSADLARSSSLGDIAVESDSVVQYVGGLIGWIESAGRISSSFASGEVALASSSTIQRLGGLVGKAYGSVDIIDSYSQVPVLEGTAVIGGLVGENIGALNVMNSYVSSAISSSNSRGAVVGDSYGDVSTTGFVWRYDNDELSDAPDVSDLVGVFNDPATLTSYRVSATSSTLMRSGGIFTDLGWDFESIWEMSGTDSWLCFPVLQWQEVVGDESCDDGDGGGGGDPAPEGEPSTVTSVSNSDTLAAMLGKSRVLTLEGAGLGDIRSASIAGQSLRIDASKSGFNKIVIPRLPLLPSGMYKLSLVNSAGAAIVVLDVRVVAKAHKLKGYRSTDALNAALRKAIRKTTGIYPTATKVRCWGVVVDATSAGDRIRAQDRATNTCAFLDKAYPNIEVQATTRKGKPIPAKNNVVRIRFIK